MLKGYKVTMEFTKMIGYYIIAESEEMARSKTIAGFGKILSEEEEFSKVIDVQVDMWKGVKNEEESS